MHAKRILIAALLAAGFAVSAHAAGFAKTAEYADNQFADVPAAEWYAPEVKSTFELGLMKGEGEGVFNPNGNVTVGEAVTMAARAAAIYAGETIDTNVAGEWYAPYVAYATAKGFVTEGQFDNYDRPAKRKEVAVLFENAMPDGYFAAQNDVTKIPDVSDKQSYQSDLLNLYKAGVVMGSDSYGNFFPENNITRAEAAAIINRVALPENRLAKSLDKITDDDAYALILSGSMNGSKEGINSGWVLDNRGGAPRTSLTANYSALFDVDPTAGTAMIRDLNKTSTGVIHLTAPISVNGDDGVYLEYRNDSDESVYRIEMFGNEWKLLGADGSYTTVYTIENDMEKRFNFDIYTDLDNNRSTTYINNKLCGTYPLATSGDKTNLYNFRIGTTEESEALVALTNVYAYANYTVRESFGSGTAVPFDWTASETGVSSSGSKLYLKEGGTASKVFNAVSGKVIAETNLLICGDATTMALRSGEKTLLTFAHDGNALYANGEKVYDLEYTNLWYRMRFELDTDAQTILVKLNGRKIGEVQFADASTSVDNVVFSNTTEENAAIDYIYIYREAEHDDYVPVPVKPAGEEKYIVGMNVCSLWRNGGHFGWSCISPFDDPQPVLGYYDEGVVETADWEIKYLVEHGIDFQAFCVYFGQQSGPINMGAEHLYSAYQNAKYSDMMKYTIIWECANSQSPNSIETWKNDWVPYFIENYFKDDRFMTIDNQPVICVFGEGNLSSRLGGNAKVKEAFDYLENEAKKMGFDGVIYLNCGSSKPQYAEMGFDGCYAYNWGTAGYLAETNKNNMLSSANEGSVYTVPTVSVGFNNVPWAGTRHPMMSMEDYADAHEWVKTEYLPTYAKEDWQKNFVMLSTWNEYGEGTYIMPSTDEKGFGYIDVIREAYTDEKADASLNTVPTEAQKYRINHLYPQYIRLLRKEGWAALNTSDVSTLEASHTIDYTKIELSGATLWSINDKTAKVQNGALYCEPTGGDPILILQGERCPKDVSLDDVVAVRMTAKVPKGSASEFYYLTEDDKAWGENKKFTFPASTGDEMAEYVVNVENAAKFKGTLAGVRLDVVSSKDLTFEIKTLEFLTRSAGNSYSKKLNINGNVYNLGFAPEKAENGDALVAFDPVTAMDFALNTFYRWDKANGVLTLNFKDHTIVYTVGSDKYTLDGTAKSLGYKLPEVDGLPMIPMNLLCKDVGYTYSVNDANAITIETPQKEYFSEDTTGERVFGQWEFNRDGDYENWGSGFMALIVKDGYMSCDSLEVMNDPTITYRGELTIPAEKYTKLSYRVRCTWTNIAGDTRDQELTMYFITDKDKAWSESKTLKIPLDKETAAEWQEYSIDTASNPLWKDNITALRFDPFNAYGHIDIDYIRFLGDSAAASGDTDSKSELMSKPNAVQTVYDAEALAEKSVLWSCQKEELEVENGLATASGTGTDPIVILTDVIGEFNAEDAPVIRVGMKWDQKIEKEANLYFTIPGENWSWDKHVEGVEVKKTEDGVVEFVYDMASNSKYQGKITGLRFDPFDFPGDFGLAYVILEKEGDGSEASAADAKPKQTVYDAEAVAKDSVLWNCKEEKMAVKEGLATATGSSDDPIVLMGKVTGEFNAADVKTVRIGMKWDQKIEKEAILFFSTPNQSWDWGRRVEGVVGTTTDDGVVELVFDMTSNSSWKGTITGLRFDPIGKPAEFGIAYVILEK